MQRTQIYFPEYLHEDLRLRAAAVNVSLSEYIRMILEEKLYRKPVGKNITSSKKVNLMVIAKKAISFGKKDLARNFDKYFEKSLR